MKNAAMFDVPNDDEGKEFMRLFKKYKKRGVQARLRGRGPRVEPALEDMLARYSYFQDLPLRHAKKILIYLEDHNKISEIWKWKFLASDIRADKMHLEQVNILREAQVQKLKKELGGAKAILESSRVLTHGIKI
jgi:hypothetical protein